MFRQVQLQSADLQSLNLIILHPRRNKILSVIIPWRDRPEIERTLEHNRSLLPDAEVIVVNCGGDHDALMALLSRVNWPAVRDIWLPMERFNKCRALNRGVASSCGEHLFFLDADVLLQPDWLPSARASLDEGFVTIERVHESQPFAPIPDSHIRILRPVTELVTRDGRQIRLVKNERDLVNGTRGGPGLILLRRADFLAVGGMHSGLEGWGWEDIDLIARLQIFGLRRRFMGEVVHLSHGDETRALYGERRSVTESRNFHHSLRRYVEGNFQGTYAEELHATDLLG